MGFRVGVAAGLAVGAGVGLAVGSPVGLPVGSEVLGARVGGAIGTEVVGKSVGRRVGPGVGELDGAAVVDRQVQARSALTELARYDLSSHFSCVAGLWLYSNERHSGCAVQTPAHSTSVTP